MTTKRIVLLTAAVMFTAISGQAFAGETISDTRYWPSNIHASSETTVARPENALASMQQQKPTDQEHRYNGGPKSEY
jgi:hypothetical protein